MLTLGKILGCGSYKACYEVLDNPDLVALTGDEDVLKRELRDLEALRGLGVPVPETYGLHRVRQGMLEVVAMLQQRLIGNMEYQYSPEPPPAPTISSLIRIREVLLRNRVVVGDLQFLVDGSGSAYVHDPIGVHVDQPIDDVIASLYSIDYAIEVSGVSEDLE